MADADLHARDPFGAHLLASTHINYIVSAGVRSQSEGFVYMWRGQFHRLSPQQMTDLLTEANYQSVVAFDERLVAGVKLAHVSFERLRVNLVWALKALDVYETNAFHIPDYSRSEVRAVIEIIRRRVIQHLRGYREAPIEITRQALAQVRTRVWSSDGPL